MKQKKILGLILIFLLVSSTEINNNDHKQYQSPKQANKQVTTPTIGVQVPSNNKPLSIKGPTIDTFAEDKDKKQAIVTNAQVVPTKDDKNERQSLNNNSTTMKASDNKDQSLKENLKSSINSLQKQQRIENKERNPNELLKELSRKNQVNNQSKQNEIKKIDEKLKTQAIQEKIQRENNPQVQQLKPKELKILKPAQKHDEKQSETELMKIKLQRPLQTNNSTIQLKQAKEDKKNDQKESKPIASKQQKANKDQNSVKKQAVLQQKSEETSKNVKVDSFPKVQIVIKNTIVSNNQSSISINKNDSVKTPQNQIKIIPLSQQQQTETQQEQQVVEDTRKLSKPAQQKQESTKVQQILKKNLTKEKRKQTQTKQQLKKTNQDINQKKLQTIKEENKYPSIDQTKQQIKINQKLPQPTKKSLQIQKKLDINQQTPQVKIQKPSMPIKQEKKSQIKVIKSEQTSKKVVPIKEKQPEVKIIPINDNKTIQIQKTESKEKKVQIQSKTSVVIKKQQKALYIEEQKTPVEVEQKRMDPIVAQPSKTQFSQPNLKELLKEVKLDLNQKAKENIIKHLQNQIKLTEQREKIQVGSSQELQKKGKQQHLKQQQSLSPIIKQEKQTSSEEIMDTPTIMVIIVFTFIISIPIFKEIKLRPPVIRESPQKESSEPTSFVNQESNQRFGMEFSDMDNQTGCAIGEPIDQQQR